MRGTAERFARRWWSGDVGIGAQLLLGLTATPLSWLWRGATEIRNRRSASRAVRIDGVRVLSVGNLAVGGTGKTPVASWLVRQLIDAGAAPALVLNGYGPDEERLHGMWTPSAPLFADRDRVAATRRAAADGARVVVLDDGFQHRRLARDLDLVLLAVEDPLPVHLLPRGPYRESLSALERADAVILTRRGRTGQVDAERTRDRLSLIDPTIADRLVASLHLTPGPLESLSPGRGVAPERLRPVHAVTAIARPDAFLDDVEQIADGVAGVSAFRDHHPFSQADAVRVRARAGTAPIVMTEKDAVKLRSFARELDDAWVLTQRLEWDWGEEELRSLVATAGCATSTPEEEGE